MVPRRHRLSDAFSRAFCRMTSRQDGRAKSALVEAHRLNSSLTVKSLIAHSPNLSPGFEGLRGHTTTDYGYQPAFGLTVRPNDWKWKDGEKHAWREHDGKGYWRAVLGRNSE
jgi:hypothetical protein